MNGSLRPDRAAALPVSGGKEALMNHTGSVLYFAAAALFFLAAWMGGGAAFYAIGTCFLALGIGSWRRDGT